METETTTENTTENENETLDPSRYNILIEFAHRHLDFHRAELESVLSISDIVIGRDCLEVTLPKNNEHNIESKDDENEDKEVDTSKEVDKEKMEIDMSEDLKLKQDKEQQQEKDKIEKKKRRKELNNNKHNYRRSYTILSFSYEYARSKFNIDTDDTIIGDEIKCTTANTTTSTTGDDASSNNEKSKKKPTIASILSRCTLIRSAIELWGAGKDIDSCASSFKSLSKNNNGEKLLSRYMDKDSTWKITVHTLGSKYNREEQNQMRFKFSCVDFPGKIQMDNPTNEFIIIREIALTSKGGPIYPRRGLNKEIIPENDKLPPLAVYYGKILGGKRDWRGQRLEKYNLKKRTYLGPTSMDSELSLVMTNLGKVQKGSFCFDPFTGTGSILLTCGLRGGYCMGTDIDIRVLRGRSEEENVFCNFSQYDLGRPELVRSDNALYSRHYRSHRPLYDAIICDPPYGIRAGARRTGSKLDQDQVRAIPEDRRHDHIAQTKVYNVSDVMADLLDVAARTLVMGGRLVYIIPSMSDFDINSDLPQHECLKLLYICYQPLQLELGRRMVTMEKVKEYNPMERDRYLSNAWINGPESAEKCARIRERLLEAAKLKPDYEEKAAIRKKKRQETRQAKKKARHDNKLKEP